MYLNLALTFWLTVSGLFSDSNPEFKGGARSLNSFITSNLIYPEYSKQNCIQGTIHVSFQLDGKGRIVSSGIEKGLGIDLDVEALRIIRLTSKRWIVPASFDTTQAIVIPINFSLREYNCENQSADQTKKAISTYRTRLDLTKAIVNFYTKKASGSFSASDELKIEGLKRELGYDQRFFDQTLRQAQQKLKQGDRESACEDFNLIRNLGSDKAEKFIQKSCL